MKVFNEKYLGSKNREALIDLEIPANFNRKVLVFVHGYMGFKDWGPWNLLQNYFVDKGFGFCKFNMTHNGTTPENQLEFIDLEAFGNNCYIYEQKDLLHVIDWLKEKIDLSTCTLHLVGHSRGGGIAMLCSGDSRVTSVTTLAAISSIEKRFEFDKEVIEEWKRTGVRYVRNGRTNQDLPHYFSQYQDFQDNKENLSIRKACESNSIPLLIIHGDKDESVSIAEGIDLASWSKNKLYIIKDASHTFGGTHPYESIELPSHLNECCETICEFVRNL
ncbi:MAG: alpha/beta hydrolase family protein [Bacteroidota bacterium]